MPDDSFAATLAAAQEGDVEAFTRLYRANHPLLLRYLRGSVREAAEDLASDTWARVVTSLGSFRGEENDFRAWLVTIARNLAADAARKRGRRPPELLDDGARLDQADHATPESLTEERDATQRALALVATLPPDVAQMVLLRVVVGLDVAEVARIVRKRPGTVRVSVHRALLRLASDLADSRAASGRPVVAGAIPRPRSVGALTEPDVTGA